jgi:hypothetical protein
MNLIASNSSSEMTIWGGWTIIEAIARTSTRGASLDSKRAELWANLRDGKLVAIGWTRTSTGQAEPIDPMLFGDVGWSEERPDVLIVTDDQTSIDIYNPRIFPALHAPNAIDLLHEKALADVFMNFVLRDPELVMLSGLCTRADRISPADFSSGHAPGPFVDFHWPLDLNADEMAYQFVDSPLHIIGDPLPTASPLVVEISEVICRRIGALIALLVEGKLQGWGTFEQTGFEGQIARLQWSRGGIFLHSQNGDLCEKVGTSTTPKYTGIMLRRAQTVEPTHPQLMDANQSVAPSKSEARFQTVERAKAECIELFCGLMRASLKERTHSKDGLRRLARKQWPPEKLTDNAIDDARREAIRITGAVAWRYSGAPKRVVSS